MTKTAYRLQNIFIDFTIVLSYIVYIFALFGITVVSPEKIDILNIYTRTYVSIFLLARFNPLIHDTEFTDLDRKIAFNAGVFLFLTSYFGNIVKQYVTNITVFIKKYIPMNRESKIQISK